MHDHWWCVLGHFWTCGEYLCTYRGMDTRVLTDMRLLGAGIILCIFLACRERKKIAGCFALDTKGA